MKARALQPATPTATGGDTPEIDRLRAALKDAEDRADLYANSRPVVEAATPPKATPEMMKAAYTAYENEDVIAYSDDWLEAVVNAALAQCGGAAQPKLEPLSALAGMFSESAHETWTKEEIVSIIEDAIRLGSPHSSTEDK